MGCGFTNVDEGSVSRRDANNADHSGTVS